MNFSRFVRQFHRWTSIAFTLTVIANILAMSAGQGQMPPPWITYSPLPPLALLMLSGLYLFALPYLAKRRDRRAGRAGTVIPR